MRNPVSCGTHSPALQPRTIQELECSCFSFLVEHPLPSWGKLFGLQNHFVENLSSFLFNWGCSASLAHPRSGLVYDVVFLARWCFACISRVPFGSFTEKLKLRVLAVYSSVKGDLISETVKSWYSIFQLQNNSRHSLRVRQRRFGEVKGEKEELHWNDRTSNCP